MPRVDHLPQPASRREQTILIVDDEAPLRDLMRETLEEEGYVVVEAESGQEALLALKSHTVDLVVTDHGLPGGLSGGDVVIAASSARPDIKILYISGYAPDELRDKGRAFLGKPFSPTALTSMVRSLLGVP